MDLASVPLRRLSISAAAVVVALALATGLVAALESIVLVPNASAAYLLAVIGLAVARGTWAAAVGAIGSFLAYNFLFVHPVRTFDVVDPGEWLNLLLLLVVGLVVGRLAGLQRDRAAVAELQAREAGGLFRVSRLLATNDSRDALPMIVAVLRDETRMGRVWIGLTGGTPLESVVADTGIGVDRPDSTRHQLLRRTAGEAPAEWVGMHAPVGPRRTIRDPAMSAHRVVIEAGGRSLGSIWSLRPRALGHPTREETRLLAGAADQIGQALERDRLRAEATGLEVARQSDALKSALLDTVSHDLRTPLATIRAAAGALTGVAGESAGSALAGPAAVIDRQAQYLDRLVTNLLDLSRAEAGSLRPDLQPISLDDAVADTVDRLQPVLRDRALSTDIPAALPPVLVDEVHLAAIVTNLLENAIAHTAAGSPIVVRGALSDDDRSVRLVVEDGGPGVPDEALGRLFEKFYRVTTGGGPARGSGIGLAVVRSLAEAGGGRVAARRSGLGGLAIEVEFPVASAALETG
ncbi:MAG TPA: ATP-binding protein [Candidatus Limnocylindrales bacterium]|nr:ATP-binding protein [Candidatus Limnocylindrales bacterium]